MHFGHASLSQPFTLENNNYFDATLPFAMPVAGKPLPNAFSVPRTVFVSGTLG
jgi:hypothetical protein